jgi:hypothetical protein
MHPVIKTIFMFSLLLIIASCKVKEKIKDRNNEKFKVINAEIIKHLTDTNIDTLYLSNKFSNNSLLHYLDELTYEENGLKKNHILTTSFGMDEEIVMELFNINQILFYKQNIYEKQKIDLSRLNSNKVKVFDFEKAIINFSGGSDPNLGKSTYTISKPIFTKNMDYSIIYFSFGNFKMNNSTSGITIYKNINNNWVIYRKIILDLE